MSDLHLHIVSFDIPYPANYGGVIDVFYKAKFLAEKGVKVHLHCFEYGRKHPKTLEKLFFKVHFYERDISKKQVFKSIPYVVSSRISEKSGYKPIKLVEKNDFIFMLYPDNELLIFDKFGTYIKKTSITNNDFQIVNHRINYLKNNTLIRYDFTLFAEDSLTFPEEIKIEKLRIENDKAFVFNNNTMNVYKLLIKF